MSKPGSRAQLAHWLGQIGMSLPPSGIVLGVWQHELLLVCEAEQTTRHDAT